MPKFHIRLVDSYDMARKPDFREKFIHVGSKGLDIKPQKRKDIEKRIGPLD